MVITHALAELPNECCGLLAGRIVAGIAIVESHFPIRNDQPSPSAFLTNPRDLLAAMRITREAKLDVLAFYHSHPRSAAVPSRRDLEQNTWGETAAHIIIGHVESVPEFRAWWLGEANFTEVAVLSHREQGEPGV